MEDIINLFILILLEVILGIDNVLFISIVVQNVKEKTLVRYIGLSLALVIRIVMLIYIKLLLGLDATFMNLPVKSLILGLGGAFLVIKSTTEIYKDLFSNTKEVAITKQDNFYYAILQVILIDLVFSLDSVLAAIALTRNIIIITVSFAVAIVVMIKLSNYSIALLRDFPGLKMLALMFIMVVGVLLIAEGVNFHIPRAYLYTAFIFSLIVELLNIILNKNQQMK